MSAQILRRSLAVRRSPCSSCLLARRTRAYYSQSVASRLQDPDCSVSAGTGARTQTSTWTDSTDSRRTIADARNPLDPTPLDRYLASIKAANLEPTLDDIERCKPESFSDPDSARYTAEYTTLLVTLCRSFSKGQLRRFTELYKLDSIWTRSSRRKTEYAESIIEKAWGWPSLKEIERKRRDMTEVLVKSFTVTPSQLFLMMGRDGADLLQLSTQYNARISLTTNPLALRVEGLRGPLKGLTEFISSLKKGIIDEIFELPTGRPIRPDLLQRLSRLSGAYVENHGHRGKIRACAKHPSDIIVAKQMALRASLEPGTQERVTCFDPPDKMRNSPIEISEPRRYSLYPFVTPASFPWTMHPGGPFRLRRVADWLGVDSCEDIASTGGLAENPHRLLNLDQSGEELSYLVRPAIFEGASYHQRAITASFGHVLLSSGGNSRATIFPPLSGAFALPDILKWIRTSGAPLTFVPSIPSAMMKTIGEKQRVLHRLIYKTLPRVADQAPAQPQHVLKFEMELSDVAHTGIQATQEAQNRSTQEDTLLSDESDSSTNHASSPGTLPEALSNSSCRVGRETFVTILLPDRPADLQLRIFDWDGVTLMQQPQFLREYAGKLCHSNTARLPQPDPPTTISYDGRTYYLYDNFSLRQSTNSSLSSTFCGDGNTDSSTEVCIESVVDRQSAQKAELCRVDFNGTTDGPGWTGFLTTCDQLSVASLQSQTNDKPQTLSLEK